MERTGVRRAVAVAFVACVLGWPLHAGTVYVKGDANGTGDGSSWANAFTGPQPAIETCLASGGGEVWIAAGVYKPDSRPNGGDVADPRMMHFSLRNGVAVHGGFPADATDGRADCDDLSDADPDVNRVVLSGDIGVADTDTNGDGVPDEPGGDSGDNTYHVFFHPQDIRLQSDAVLTGVCITAGRATGTAYDHRGGGGMLNHTGASPMLVNCSFIRNYASSRGGGMSNVNSSQIGRASCRERVFVCV